MKRRTLLLVSACTLAVPGIASAATKADSQAEVRKAAQEALSAVYKAQPSARKAVESAAGYAAFSNFGMKILFAGGGSGKGIAVSNKTKATTYMKMAEIQAGIGFGVKKFKLLWVFETDNRVESIRQFRLGNRRAGHGRCEKWRQGQFLPRRCLRRTRGLALPTHRRRSGAGADRQGNEVLQGQ